MALFKNAYHTTIDIQAPPSKVWAVITDFDTYPDWNPVIGKVEGQLIQGNTLRLEVLALKATFKAELTVVEENKELRWWGYLFSKKLAGAEHYFKLEPNGKGGTIFKHGEYFKGIFANLTPSPIANKMKILFEEHNQLLKQRVESQYM